MERTYVYKIYIAKTGKRKLIDTLTSDYCAEDMAAWEYYEMMCKDGNIEMLKKIHEEGWIILAVEE